MKLLFLNSCVTNHSPSRTKYLCDHYLSLCREQGWETTEVDLTALSLLPLTSDVLQQREKAAKEHRWEDPALALALQFQQADRIVIGAPYWDLSFPSVLKVYLEHIMVNHVVFRFTENGATGLCKADKLVYIMTAGGFVGGRNFGYDYIRALSRMVGITEVEQYCAEGLDLDGVDTYPILQDVMGKMEV